MALALMVFFKVFISFLLWIHRSILDEMVAGLVAKQILRDDEVLFDGKIFKPLLGRGSDKFYLSERDHWATAKRDGGGSNDVQKWCHDMVVVNGKVFTKRPFKEEDSVDAAAESGCANRKWIKTRAVDCGRCTQCLDRVQVYTFEQDPLFVPKKLYSKRCIFLVFLGHK